MDTAEYLDELARTLASHGSNLAALRMAELEQKVSPYLAAPGVPSRQVGSDVVAQTLGNVEAFFGQTNLLADPTWEGVEASNAGLLGTAEREISKSAWYVTLSHNGTNSTFDNSNSVPRGAPATGYSSNCIVAKLGVAALGAGTYTMTVRSASLQVTEATRLPFVVGALREKGGAGGISAGVTAASVTLQIWDTYSGSALASAALDLSSGADAASNVRWSVSSDSGAPFASGHLIQLRLVLTLVKTSGTGYLEVQLGEPQLGLAYTQDPGPYAPILARWEPRSLTASDVRLSRSTTKTLTIDDTAAGAATLNVVGAIHNDGTRVVGSRKGGWGAPTGTAERAAFDTASVTTAQLAQRVKALIDDLWLHGLIGGADAGHALATGAAYSPTVVIT